MEPKFASVQELIDHIRNQLDNNFVIMISALNDESEVCNLHSSLGRIIKEA